MAATVIAGSERPTGALLFGGLAVHQTNHVRRLAGLTLVLAEFDHLLPLKVWLKKARTGEGLPFVITKA